MTKIARFTQALGEAVNPPPGPTTTSFPRGGIEMGARRSGRAILSRAARGLAVLVFAAAVVIPAGAARASGASFTSSGPLDGWVLESSRTSGRGGSYSRTGLPLRVGDDAAGRQYRSVVSFDTAALPDGAVIAAATLRLRLRSLVRTPFATHGDLVVDARAGSFSGNPALQTGDFRAVATLPAAAVVGTAPAEGWYTCAVPPAVVNRAGWTQLRLRFSRGDDGDGRADYVAFASGDAAEADRPVLEVTVTDPPAAAFTTSPESPVAGEGVQFADASTNGPTSWSWDFGDGTVSGLQHPVHAYADAGSFTVSLTAGNAAGSGTVTKALTVRIAAPVAGFTYSPGEPGAGQTVTFTDTSTGSPTSWSWTFGDGATSSLANPSHAYAAPGTYTVSLTAGNAGGSTAASHDVVVTGGGPAACTVSADCAAPGACPPDAAAGCACAPTPQGDRCVPQCSTADDCPQPPDQTLVCDTDGLCVPDGGGGGGGGGGDTGMTIDDTVSDEAQAMTIAFDGLAFVTGTFCSQTFYPPGKVADFFGFQYLRDNDPSGMGHNTDFTTLTADPILVLLSDSQLETLADLGTAEAALNDAYGYARFPLAMAFRRLNDGDLPAGKTGLSREAMKAYSGYLFGIDGEMSYLRAQAYASVLGTMDAGQQAALAAMKGKGSLEWTQPTQAEVDAVLAKYPGQMMRTYAGEMLAWYLGSIDADVYFCPERQGTYFGSFFMKDVKAMHNPSYTIDSNMTAEMGDAFLAALDATQKDLVTGLVAEQKPDLLAIVAKRDEISRTLRNFLAAGGTVDEATVIGLARQYGELDGEISYFYATNFSAVGTTLTADQQATLTALRKTATAEEGGTPDYDTLCGNGYLYSSPLKAPPVVMDTDFMFGVCGAEGGACGSDWDCCSFSCAGGACEPVFTLTSTAFVNGGTLPGDYTCDGTGGMSSPSPPLAWTGAPAGTQEYALTISTIALDGTKWNWVLFHIPGDVTSLAEGTAVGTAGVSTDGPDLRYYPPCSSGPGEKTYTFTLYALSAIPTFTVPESQVTGEILLGAIAPLVIGTRQVDVTYTRTGL